MSKKPRPWLREFHQDHHHEDDWFPPWCEIIAIDDDDVARCWGFDKSRPEDEAESWRVPADAVLPDLGNGRPAEYVFAIPRYSEAMAEFGMSRVSAMLRQDANCPATCDRLLLEDLEFARLAGELHAGDLSLIEMLRWTGEHIPDDRDEAEARLIDLCWVGR